VGSARPSANDCPDLFVFRPKSGLNGGQVTTKAQFGEILENYIRWRQQFVDEHGELLPRFRQPPMIASFMREAEPASTRREHIGGFYFFD
jgi:hypothetical protein